MIFLFVNLSKGFIGISLSPFDTRKPDMGTSRIFEEQFFYCKNSPLIINNALNEGVWRLLMIHAVYLAQFAYRHLQGWVGLERPTFAR